MIARPPPRSSYGTASEPLPFQLKEQPAIFTLCAFWINIPDWYAASICDDEI